MSTTTDKPKMHQAKFFFSDDIINDLIMLASISGIRSRSAVVRMLIRKAADEARSSGQLATENNSEKKSRSPLAKGTGKG